MQIAPIAPTNVPVASPEQRVEAAKALIAVPMGLVMSASMTAMTKTMGGQTASRADLVAPLLQKLPVDQAKAAMLQAVEGALAIEPQLAANADALRQSAEGVAALLAEAAADTTQGNAMEQLKLITTPLQTLMQPFVEAALVLGLKPEELPRPGAG